MTPALDACRCHRRTGRDSRHAVGALGANIIVHHYSIIQNPLAALALHPLCGITRWPVQCGQTAVRRRRRPTPSMLSTSSRRACEEPAYSQRDDLGSSVLYTVASPAAARVASPHDTTASFGSSGSCLLYSHVCLPSRICIQHSRAYQVAGLIYCDVREQCVLDTCTATT